MRVLVVHPDRRLAEALAIRSGWAISHADRWPASQRLIEHTAFDAWVLDERTVGDRGLRLLAALRSFGEAHAVLWLRTPESGVVELIDALVAGVTDCLRNPVDASEVCIKLSAYQIGSEAPYGAEGRAGSAHSVRTEKRMRGADERRDDPAGNCRAEEDPAPRADATPKKRLRSSSGRIAMLTRQNR